MSGARYHARASSPPNGHLSSPLENVSRGVSPEWMDDEASNPGWLRAVAKAPDVAPSDLVGCHLGRYAIREVLGRGGMGIVYLADDTTLGRRTALKVLPATELGDAERRARFVREAKLAAAVNSPHVAAVYDAGEIDQTIFLAMEYVPGKTLRAILRERRLTIDEVHAIARGVARALAAVHAAGIVHRDVKPENVIVAEPHVKLVDLGAARSVAPGATTETAEGQVIGTPAYMSPEQAKGHAVDPRSDVFSFGVLVYEMLAGERPFRGRGAVETIIAIDRDPAPRVDAARVGVPRALSLVIERCLRKDPNARWNDGTALLTALEAASARLSRSSVRAIAGAVVVGIGALLLLRRSAATQDAPPGQSSSAAAPSPPPSGGPAIVPVVSISAAPSPTATSSAVAVVAPLTTEHRALDAGPAVARAARPGPLDESK